MSTVAVELVHIPEINRAIFGNLLQLYLHDMSEFTGDGVDDEGLFEVSEQIQRYWHEPERHPFFIKVRDRHAGFVLVREIAENTHSIAEFFVIRRLRGCGVGKSAAFRVFDRFPGAWHVAQEEANLPAQAFWRTIIGEYTGGRFEEGVQDAHPKGPVQIFKSPRAE